MRKIRILTCVLMTVCSLCLLCGCSPGPLNDGETYLEGTWYYSDDLVNVGYNLFADGGGFLFIGDNVSAIRYGIFEGRFYISANGEQPTSMEFAKTEEGLLIGGMLFVPVEEDPSAEESIQQALSRAEEEGTVAKPAPNVGFYVTAAIAFALAIFIMLWLVRYFRNKKFI